MTTKAIRAALTRCGQMTVAQLCDRTGLCESTISTQLKTLRADKEVYVSGWVLMSTIGPGRNRATYSLGNEPNVPCPPRGRRALVKAHASPVAPTVIASNRAYADARQQAGMWGALMA